MSDDERAEMAARFARTTPPHGIRRWPLPRVTSDTIESLRRELEAADAVDRPEIERAFRAKLRREGTPLVEPDSHPEWCRVTFVWIGESEFGVVLQLNRVSDPLDIEDTLLERITESNVHALTLRLPAAWQGSYLFAILPRRVEPTLHAPVDVSRLMEFAKQMRADEFAREVIPSKEITASGGMPIPSYAAARGPEAPQVALWQQEAPATKLLGNVVSPIGRAKLPLHHWAAEGASESSPVVLLFDGEVWRSQFPVAVALAELVARGETPPMHVLYLESGGSKQRQLDYTGSPEETGALLEATRAVAAAAVPDTTWILAGQSLGGLVSMLAATRHPHLVRAAVAQSPSLWWPTEESAWVKGPGWFEERAAATDPAPICLEAGIIEPGVIEYTRSAAALLRVQNALIEYNEYPSGHDVLQWQCTLAGALATAIAHTA